jgi:hypothetical protein
MLPLATAEFEGKNHVMLQGYRLANR